MKPWTVLGQVGRFQEESDRAPACPSAWHQTPAIKTPLPRHCVTVGNEDPGVHQDKTSALLTWCPDLPHRGGATRHTKKELGGFADTPAR